METNKYIEFVLHVEEWEKHNIAYSVKDMRELATKLNIEEESLIS